MSFSIKSHNERHHVICDLAEVDHGAEESYVVAEVYSSRPTARTMANSEDLLVAAIALVKSAPKTSDGNAYTGSAQISALAELETQIRYTLGPDAVRILDGENHVSGS